MSYDPLSSPLEKVLSKFPGVRPTGGSGNRWKVRCPGHKDENPSLSIREGRDGRVLLKCFAGCRTEHVVRCMGLEMSDLFPPREEERPSRYEKKLKRQARWEKQVGEMRRGGHETRRQAGPRTASRPLGRIVATYNYRDKTNVLLFQVVRYQPKTFRQRRPDGRGGWIWNLDGVPRVLYRLPALLAADPVKRFVFVPEGEKDVKRLSDLGLVATCNPGGAGKWKHVDDSPLEGRRVVLICDKDAAGRMHVEDAAQRLHGRARSVRVLELPDRKGHAVKDAADWIKAGGTRKALVRLVKETPRYQPRVQRVETPRPAPNGAQQDEPEWELDGDIASDVVCQKLRWLWPNRIPSGKMTMLFGDADRGKSLVALDIAAIVSRGRRWPDGAPDARKRRPGGVVILSAEDDPEDTIVPRLKAAGADTERIYLLRGTRIVDGSSELYFDLTHDLPALEEATKRVKPCRLVVIDPVTAYTGKTDTHVCAEVRGLLAPLAALAAQRRIAVLLISHMTKAAGLQALSRIMGSQAFGAAVRAAWLAVTDQNDPARRLFLPVKMNLGPKPAGLAYHIGTTEVGGCGSQPRIRWEDGAVEGITANEALAAWRPGQPRMSEAKAWLRAALKDGPADPKALEKEAKRERLAWGTILRAKKELDVRSRRIGFGEKGGWKWVLQRPAAQLPERGGIAREGILRGIRDFKGAHAKVRTHTPRMRNHQR